MNNSASNPEFFHLSPLSGNSKTGPIAVSTSHSKTCPDNCKLKNNGCYAGMSFLGMHWRAIDSGNRGVAWDEFILQIKALPRGRLFRLNQAGDLPGNFDRLDSDKCSDLISATKRVIPFTYTHYPVLENNAKCHHNRAVIHAMNKGGITVNLSADNLAEADSMLGLSIAPVVTLLPADSPKVQFTPQGNKVVTCPATYREDINCDNCRICADNSPKRSIIGFPVHGSQKAKAQKVFSIKKVD